MWNKETKADFHSSLQR